MGKMPAANSQQYQNRHAPTEKPAFTFHDFNTKEILDNTPMNDSIIENVFRNLYGEPCWNAKSGYGSFLTMEFGLPLLDIHEPIVPSKIVSPKVASTLARRQITVHGQWHLWIEICEWQVVTNGKRIGHSNLAGSSKRPIQRAAQELDGQKLVRVSFDLDTYQTIFEFDLGSRLETQPCDQDSDQWSLYEPSGDVFVLRGDGFYSHGPGNTRPDEMIWKPMSDAKRFDPFSVNS